MKDLSNNQAMTAITHLYTHTHTHTFSVYLVPSDTSTHLWRIIVKKANTDCDQASGSKYQFTGRKEIWEYVKWYHRNVTSKIWTVGNAMRHSDPISSTNPLQGKATMRRANLYIKRDLETIITNWNICFILFLIQTNYKTIFQTIREIWLD